MRQRLTSWAIYVPVRTNLKDATGGPGPPVMGTVIARHQVTP